MQDQEELNFYPTSFDNNEAEIKYETAPTQNNYFSQDGIDDGEVLIDELPLLDELGIYPSHIWKRTNTVLNPFTKNVDPDFLDDSDVAGPLVFCLLLGFVLLLGGKIHFGFIYGVGSIGCLGIYLLLNLMCDQNLSIYQTISVLGYCLLPIVLLATVGIIFHLNGIAGYILSFLFIVWATNSASLIFITALSMSHQRLLVAYPVGLFYISFALMAVF
eukprot:TRINITY_DN604_c0_g3_i1.p1 TRINITY_DN604_c0_g3~~TRINITY_DN604_c0_g3_i1.p1  ORF type:complete len:242 (+),score=58.45 TRINITY_DN604_c0_g3_i1:77-727(+)